MHLSGPRDDIAPVDHVGRIEIALHHALLAKPSDLVQHILNIDALIGIGIGDGGADLGDVLAERLRDDREHFRRIGSA